MNRGLEADSRERLIRAVGDADTVRSAWRIEGLD